MTKHQLSAFAIAPLSLFALSTPAEAKLSYNYLELGYAFASTDDIGDIDLGDTDSINVGASFGIADSFFVFGNSDWAELSGATSGSAFDLTAGVGGYFSLGGNVDLIGRAAWRFASIDIDSISDVLDIEDESGVVFDVGLRAELGNQFEIGAFIGWENVGDIADGTAIDVYGLYKLTPAFQIGAAATLNDNSDAFRGFVRYNF